MAEMKIYGSFVGQKLSQIRFVEEKYKLADTFISGSWGPSTNTVNLWQLTKDEFSLDDGDSDYVPKSIAKINVDGDVTGLEFLNAETIVCSTSSKDGMFHRQLQLNNSISSFCWWFDFFSQPNSCSFTWTTKWLRTIWRWKIKLAIYIDTHIRMRRPCVLVCLFTIWILPLSAKMAGKGNHFSKRDSVWSYSVHSFRSVNILSSYGRSIKSFKNVDSCAITCVSFVNHNEVNESTIAFGTLKYFNLFSFSSDFGRQSHWKCERIRCTQSS